MEKEEKRFIPLDGDNIEVRQSAEGKREIHMKIPYNSWSFDLGGFKERILPGFFDESIADGKIQSFWGHDRSLPLGRQGNETLRFEDKKSHVVAIATPPDTQWGRDALIATEGGFVEGASFTFRAIEDKWTAFEKSNKLDERDLIKGIVTEFSPVTQPAYPRSGIQARSMLAGVGIDLDIITAAFEARGAGRELDADSQEVVRSAIGALTDLLPQETEQEPVVETVEDDGQESIDLMEKKLELQNWN